MVQMDVMVQMELLEQMDVTVLNYWVELLRQLLKMVKTVTLTSMQLQVMFTKKKAKTGSKSVILEDHKVLKVIKDKMELKDHKV